MEGYREKLEDIRTVISMLVNINNQLCEEVDRLNDMLAESERKNSELLKQQEKSDEIVNKLNELSDTLSTNNEDNFNKLNDSINESQKSVKSKMDDICSSLSRDIKNQNNIYTENMLIMKKQTEDKTSDNKEETVSDTEKTKVLTETIVRTDLHGDVDF